MHVASHDLFNMKLRTCLDIGMPSVLAYVVKSAEITFAHSFGPNWVLTIVALPNTLNSRLNYH